MSLPVLCKVGIQIEKCVNFSIVAGRVSLNLRGEYEIETNIGDSDR